MRPTERNVWKGKVYRSLLTKGFLIALTRRLPGTNDAFSFHSISSSHHFDSCHLTHTRQRNATFVRFASLGIHDGSLCIMPRKLGFLFQVSFRCGSKDVIQNEEAIDIKSPNRRCAVFASFLLHSFCHCFFSQSAFYYISVENRRPKTQKPNSQLPTNMYRVCRLIRLQLGTPLRPTSLHSQLSYSSSRLQVCSSHQHKEPPAAQDVSCHSRNTIASSPWQPQFWAHRSTWKRAGINTLRCLVGCTAGDFSTMWLLQTFYPELGMGPIMAASSTSPHL